MGQDEPKNNSLFQVHLPHVDPTVHKRQLLPQRERALTWAWGGRRRDVATGARLAGAPPAWSAAHRGHGLPGHHPLGERTLGPGARPTRARGTGRRVTGTRGCRRWGEGAPPTRSQGVLPLGKLWMLDADVLRMRTLPGKLLPSRHGASAANAPGMRGCRHRQQGKEAGPGMLRAVHL